MIKPLHGYVLVSKVNREDKKMKALGVIVPEDIKDAAPRAIVDDVDVNANTGDVTLRKYGTVPDTVPYEKLKVESYDVVP